MQLRRAWTHFIPFIFQFPSRKADGRVDYIFPPSKILYSPTSRPPPRPLTCRMNTRAALQSRNRDGIDFCPSLAMQMGLNCRTGVFVRHSFLRGGPFQIQIRKSRHSIRRDAANIRFAGAEILTRRREEKSGGMDNPVRRGQVAECCGRPLRRPAASMFV